MMTLTVNGCWTQFVTPLRKLEPFTTHGSLWSEVAPYGASSTGRLPSEHVASARAADYVVYSYSTPIAWHTAGEWVMPDESYSVTTSKQQGRIRTALSVLDDESYS